jgi:hypothetical protein
MNEFLMSQDGDGPSPDDVAKDALGGLGSNGSDKEQSGIPDAEYLRLKDEREQLQKRLSDTHRWGNEEHAKAKQLEDQLQQMQREKQRMLEEYQRAQQAQEPEIDWEDVAGDPDKLKEAFGQYGQYIERRVHSVYSPLAEERIHLRDEVNRLKKAHTQSAQSTARDGWKSRGFDVDTFDEVWHNVQEMIDAGHPLTTAEDMIRAAMLVADTRNLQLVDRKSVAPVSTSTDPSMQARSSVPADLQRQYDRLQARFGLEREELSDADLEEMRLSMPQGER